MSKRMKLSKWIFQDWSANRNNPVARLILTWFRLAQWAHRHWGLLGKLTVVGPYSLLTTLVLSMELPVTAQIGPRLRLPHKHGLVIHADATLGSDCLLRQGVTVGSKPDRERSQTRIPRIGNDVEFGAGCVLIGDITVGDHARIGALTIVTRSVPDYGVVVGNPGRVIKIDRPATDEQLACHPL
jgi:putative colanic acid biosynthesis acetyltransferase WcaB